MNGTRNLQQRGAALKTGDLAQSFRPLVGAQPHSLILGSMPGRASLREQRYYAHPRNSFWRIIQTLLGLEADTDYDTCCAALTGAGYALWDVLARCERPGSLDAKILSSSVQANDFRGFYAANPGIERVFFNGAAAQSLYRRHVLPGLSPALAILPAVRLPSTSPAHAGMSELEKSRRWRAALAR